jgi:hypothetical protein
VAGDGIVEEGSNDSAEAASAEQIVAKVEKLHEEALDTLQQSVKAGLTSEQLAELEEKLAPLKLYPRYAEITATLKPRQ